jgi:hypothetical protein
MLLGICVQSHKALDVRRGPSRCKSGRWTSDVDIHVVLLVSFTLPSHRASDLHGVCFVLLDLLTSGFIQVKLSPGRFVGWIRVFGLQVLPVGGRVPRVDVAGFVPNTARVTRCPVSSNLNAVEHLIHTVFARLAFINEQLSIKCALGMKSNLNKDRVLKNFASNMTSHGSLAIFSERFEVNMDVSFTMVDRIYVFGKGRGPDDDGRRQDAETVAR